MKRKPDNSIAIHALRASHAVTRSRFEGFDGELLLGIALIVLAVLLSSCVPADAAVQRDLYSEAQSSRATSDAANYKAELLERSLTTTAEAPIIRITETAAGVSIQNTQAAGTTTAGVSTQTASYVQTAVLWTPTADLPGTKAAVVLDAESQALANNAARDALALEREANNNAFWAAMGQMAPLLSMVLLVGLIILFSISAVRKQRFQPVQVDARGNVLPLLDTVEGTVTDSDRNPNYRSHTAEDLLKGLLVLYLEKKFGYRADLPQITDKRQDAVTERDQITDLATRGLLPETVPQARERKQEAGQQAMKLLTGPTLESRWKFIEDPNELHVIDGEIVQDLDNAWKDAKR